METCWWPIHASDFVSPVRPTGNVMQDRSIMSMSDGSVSYWIPVGYSAYSEYIGNIQTKQNKTNGRPLSKIDCRYWTTLEMNNESTFCLVGYGRRPPLAFTAVLVAVVVVVIVVIDDHLEQLLFTVVSSSIVVPSPRWNHGTLGFFGGSIDLSCRRCRLCRRQWILLLLLLLPCNDKSTSTAASCCCCCCQISVPSRTRRPITWRAVRPTGFAHRRGTFHQRRRCHWQRRWSVCEHNPSNLFFLNEKINKIKTGNCLWKKKIPWRLDWRQNLLKSEILNPFFSSSSHFHSRFKQ